ncbi:uncharacterized protein BDV14DRAFT_176453 [Aspergillus stella-maris]|uniref:uncharacterized protein n=1 Tax=Aspergillus stella-maris TaxID=1810926 RepID=UPI003CCCBE4C
MAPRRGGSSYGGGSSISCSDYAFETKSSRIDIAFTALYFVVSLVLFIIATRRFGISKKQGQPVAGAFLLGTSICLAMLYYLDSIIYIVIGQCGSVGVDDYFPAIIISQWLYWLSKWTMIAVIMTSICHKLMKDFSRAEQLVLTLQKVWVGFLGLLVITVLGLSTATNVYFYSDDYYGRDKISDLSLPMRGIQTTHLVLSAAGILLASATMAKSLSHAGSLRSKVRRAFFHSRPQDTMLIHPPKQNITIWVSILIIAALGTTLTELGGYIETSFTYWDAVFTTASDQQEYYDKRHAVYFLTAFFYSLAFYAALRVASHQVVPGHPTRVIANSPPEYAPQPTAAMNEYHAPVDQRFSTGNQNQGYFQNQIRDQTYGYPTR